MLAAGFLAAGNGLSFHLPTLATNVAPANVLAQEEVFGPVLAAMTFRNTEEAVELANNTRYGLAALGVEREHQPRAACGAAAQGRRGVGERHQHVRRLRRLAVTARAGSAARAARRACTNISPARRCSSR